MSRNIEKEYQKLSPEEHVLHRPASYIGSINSATRGEWVPEADGPVKMVFGDHTFNPGLLKIFDECVTNADDAARRDPTVTEIKVTATDTSFTVWNNGDRGIPIEVHKKHKMHVPEMIFGHCHTSSNYDDSESRDWAGTNGYGAKLAIIFSTSSEILIGQNGQKYLQTFEKNLTVRSKPKITKAKGSNSVQITVNPDFARFGLTDFKADDTIRMMYKRVLEIAALSKVKVWWNGTRQKVNSFDTFVDTFVPKKDRVTSSDGEWDVAVAFSPLDRFEQVSFVNGVRTAEGGTHVDMVTNKLIKTITERFQAKHKEVTIKPSYIKDNVMVFVNKRVVNPSYSSQTKERLISTRAQLGEEFHQGDVFVKAVEKLGILDNILEIAKAKDLKSLKSGTKTRARLTDIPKLNDANKAGGNYSPRCTIIFTEGDSAKSMAISGIQDRDFYGVFPLKGKLLNVQDVSAKKLSGNAEIQSIVKILGLRWGKTYKDANELRYGKVMIMTDQDEDGYHIKGLVMNLFATHWPSLLAIPGFITAMLTPVIKAKKGSQVQEFYNLPDYKAWSDTSGKGWSIKYYKGLGTSTSAEAKEYFRRMNILEYQMTTPGDVEAINKAFGKGVKKSATDKRKQWIQDFLARPVEINYKDTKVPVEDFVDKELVLFSIADTQRSLPNLIDGLKESQRKVLFSCFKRKLVKEIKVAQLSGYVSENSAYHHGEASLNKAIVAMAQKFVGHNNMNLLFPGGQFGSRIKGGSDAASERYIFTRLTSNASKLFKQEDEVLLNYLDDDGQPIEPDFYVPTLPLLLINGSKGIGTGFSTTMPSFNPADVKKNLLRLMKSQNPEDVVMKEMTPWYDGFLGKVKKVAALKWSTHGVFESKKATSVHVTELPIGTWTDDYVEFLKNMEAESEIVGFKDHSNEVSVDLHIDFTKEKLRNLVRSDKLEDFLKLRTTVNATNLHVIDDKGQIVKIETPEDVIRKFYVVRKRFYGLRKDHLLKRTTHELEVLRNKIRFIRAVSAQEIKLYGVKKADTLARLAKDEYYKVKTDKGVRGHQYLLDLKCEHFTEEKVVVLQKDIASKEKFLADLNEKTPLDLWKEEI